VSVRACLATRESSVSDLNRCEWGRLVRGASSQLVDVGYSNEMDKILLVKKHVKTTQITIVSVVNFGEFHLLPVFIV
jgi:hypothetical protein